jgi:hypothetical protein
VETATLRYTTTHGFVAFVLALDAHNAFTLAVWSSKSLVGLAAHLHVDRGPIGPRRDRSGEARRGV